MLDLQTASGSERLRWVGMLNFYNDVEQKMSFGAGMTGFHFLLKTLRNSLLDVRFVGGSM
jgi:hypothetical protein